MEIMRRDHEFSAYYQAQFFFEDMTVTQLTRCRLHQIKLISANLPSETNKNILRLSTGLHERFSCKKQRKNMILQLKFLI